jgi:uncharacterized membrane protein
LENKGGQMGNQSSDRSPKQKTNSKSARTAAASLIKREEIVTDYIKKYLDERERKQRKTNGFLYAIFIIYIVVAVCIFYVLNDIRQMNAEFIEIKKQVTKEMLQQYQRQVKEQDEVINEYRKDRAKE